MNPKRWKLIAIISICLIIVESILIVYAYSYGISMMDKETECQVYCQNEQLGMAYLYDFEKYVCQCFDNQGELIQSNII